MGMKEIKEGPLEAMNTSKEVVDGLKGMSMCSNNVAILHIPTPPPYPPPTHTHTDTPRHRLQRNSIFKLTKTELRDTKRPENL